MISIITVNYKSDDFLELLKESLSLFTISNYELIIIDNSINNIGHGEGLNEGVCQASYPYTMFLDVDTHVFIGWDLKFLNLASTFSIIGGRGVPAKPIRPACMFMPTSLARKYDWRASPGYRGIRVTPEGYDTGIKAYYDMLADGVKVCLLDSINNRYGTLNGEEFHINNQSVVYHHWHGTHLTERSVDFPDFDLFADKEKLFRSVAWRQFSL